MKWEKFEKDDFSIQPYQTASFAGGLIKHALVNRETVQINVDIKQRKNYVRICFYDNGPGYPQEMADGDFTNSGVGFELIQGIVSHSLVLYHD